LERFNRDARALQFAYHKKARTRRTAPLAAEKLYTNEYIRVRIYAGAGIGG
jgi:hypothetical protein